MPAPATPRRRNPQDATLRNIRALKAKLVALTTRTHRLELVVHALLAAAPTPMVPPSARARRVRR